MTPNELLMQLNELIAQANKKLSGTDLLYFLTQALSILSGAAAYKIGFERMRGSK